MDTRQVVIALLLGYAFGNIPNGYLYARAHGVDIFHQGSGNPGSTNVLRTLGKRAGATVLLMDVAKTIVPVLLLHMLWKPATVDAGTLITLYTGTGSILGHNFPCLPHLRGGKGVACTGALAIAFDWRLAIILLSFFVLLVLLTRYVSLASMMGVSAFFLSVLLFGNSGLLPMSSRIYSQCCALVFFLMLLCIFQHRENIGRLIRGEENKFGTKKTEAS